MRPQIAAPVWAAPLALLAAAAQGGLTIQVNYAGDPGTAQYAHYFTDAAQFWETLLVGYQDGNLVAASVGSSYEFRVPTPLTTVYVNAAIIPLDGPGGALASAGPDESARDASGYILTTDGSIHLDAEDASMLDANGTLGLVVLHEMAHVLGFGTQWTSNGVYQPGTGQYAGEVGNQVWNLEFGQPGPAPVELEGGGGTADAHWDEVLGGASDTGFVSGLFGEDLRYELMTGWLNTGQTPFISALTLGSFFDIGFTTVLAAVPEGSGFLFLGLVAFGAAARLRGAR